VPPEPAAGEVDTRLFEAAMRELDAVPLDAAPPRPREARPPRRIRPRKKDLRVDERIDLHRCTGEQAAKRLEREVMAAARAGSRTLLVITGKGYHSPGGVPVLRQKVEEWLRVHGERLGIEAYSEAPRVLGGRGALVVYLRRPR
jgi:DNA-nicking Smr family endonuclease